MKSDSVSRTWALVDRQGQLPEESSGGESLQSDPEIASPLHGGMAWVISCSTMVYEATYSNINGTIQALSITLANTSLGGIIATPISVGFGQVDLEMAARQSSFNANSQDLADEWAGLYSQIALGLSTGVMSPRLNIRQQTRSSILVSRVPKLPLFILIGLNLLYALSGILLALYSAFFSAPRATKDIQVRLTVAGLVVFCFEPRHRACGRRNRLKTFSPRKMEYYERARKARELASRLGTKGGGGLHCFDGSSFYDFFDIPVFSPTDSLCSIVTI